MAYGYDQYLKDQGISSNFAGPQTMQWGEMKGMDNPDYIRWQQQQAQARSAYDKQYDSTGNPIQAAAPAPAVQTQVQPQIKMTPGGGRQYEESQLKYDKEGRPITPLFESGRDAEGNLLNSLKLGKQGDITADRSALDAMKSRATSTGPSPWATMALEKQKLEQAQMGDQAATANQAQMMNARSQMAQSGGLGAGSRERLAKQGMLQGLMSQQKVNQQGMMDRSNIGLQDDQTKMGLLNQVQAGENAQAGIASANRDYSTGVDKTNLQAQIADMMAKRGFDANSYNKAMEAWGAAKSADAQRAASGGGGGMCFITTAMVDHYGLADDGDELTTLRYFRDSYMKKDAGKSADVEAYYKLAKEVDGKLRAITDEAVWQKIKDYILEAVAMIKSGRNEQAYKHYKKLVEFVKKATA